MQHVTECRVDCLRPNAPPADLERARTVYLAVGGMGCLNCANRIRNALLGIPGVVDARVDLPRALVQVWYGDPCPGPTQLLSAIGGAGAGTHHDYVAVHIRSRF